MFGLLLSFLRMSQRSNSGVYSEGLRGYFVGLFILNKMYSSLVILASRLSPLRENVKTPSYKPCEDFQKNSHRPYKYQTAG